MKIPQAQVLAGRGALQTLWEDRATLCRQERRGNKMEDQVIGSDILCHLSAKELPALRQSDAMATVGTVFTLYLPWETTPAQGDAIAVTHKGSTYQGVAGQVFHHNLSVVVRLEEVKVP